MKKVLLFLGLSIGIISLMKLCGTNITAILIAFWITVIWI